MQDAQTANTHKHACTANKVINFTNVLFAYCRNRIERMANVANELWHKQQHQQREECEKMKNKKK